MPNIFETLSAILSRRTAVKEKPADGGGVFSFLADYFKPIEAVKEKPTALPAAPIDREKVVESALRTPADILRAPARGGAAVALEARGEKEFIPRTPVEKFILGEEPVKSVTERSKEFEALGLPHEAALPAGIALTGFEIVPGVPGKKKISKEIIESLVKRYGEKAAKEIAEKGGLKLAEKALAEGGEIAVKRAGIGLAEEGVGKAGKTALGAKQAPKTAIPEVVVPKEKPKTTAIGASGETKPVVKQKFAAEKLNLDLGQEEDIAIRLSALGLERRTVKTFDDMRVAAEELGSDVGTLLKETIKSRITSDEAVALKNLINNNVKLIDNLTAEAAAKPAQAAAIEGKIRFANQQIDQALKKLVPGGTEAGRTVASFRIFARNTLDPAFWLAQAKRMLGERELTAEMQQAIFDLIAKSDRQGLANFVSMLRESTLAEKGVTLWKAGLLTSPTTHLANIGGNVTMAALETASGAVSTGLDMIASAFTGVRTTAFSPSTVAAKAKGLIEGAKKGGKFLATGVYETDIITKYDLPRRVTFESKILQGYTDAVFRSLGAEDIIFRQAAMSEALEKTAIVTAKNEGLSGTAFKTRVKQLLLDPTPEMARNAIEAAEYATFQNKNALADMISAAKSSVARKGPGGTAATVGLEITAPFVKTPTNIAARIADYSPLGFVKAVVRQMNPATRGQKALVEDLGRAVTGTGIIALGAWLNEAGIMTGNLPTSPTEKAQWETEGKLSRSILFEGRWYQLSRVSPFGNLLALGAEMNELSKEKGGIALGAASFGAGVKGLTEQTFLKGVSGGLKAVSEPERFAPAFIEQSVASVVPSVIGRTARIIDPYSRVPEGILEAVQARIPFLTEGLPAKRDIFGERIEAPGGRAGIIDPFSSRRAENQSIIDEARKIGANLGLPGETVSGTKLTNAEYDLYAKVQGKILKPALQALINDPAYQALPTREKQREFESVIRSTRDQLSDAIFPALMIKRYQLPLDTNPEILRDLLDEMNTVPQFKEADVKIQTRAVRSALEAISKQK